MKSVLERETFPRLLMLFGSAMVLSFGLVSAFIPSLAHLNYFVHHYYNGFTTSRVEYPPLEFKLTYYLTLWMIVASIGGLLGLIAYLVNDKRSISLSFTGTFIGFSGFILFMFEFGSHPPFITIPEVDYFLIPWLGMSLTFLGILMMFTGSVAYFHTVPSLLYVLVPSLVSTLAYNVLVITNNVPYILLIAQSVSSSAIVGWLLLTLGIVFWGNVLCLLKAFLWGNPEEAIRGN